MKKSGVVLFVYLSFMLVQQAYSQTIVPVKDSTVVALEDTAYHNPEDDKIGVKKSFTKQDSLINYAYTFIGKRYRKGGTGAVGFDCSGYTMTVFKQFNIKLPHTSAGQGLMGVEVTRNNIKKGDLILFKGRNRRSRRIGHVGIVISEKGEPVRFIHSSTSDGVRIDRLEYEYYKKRYLKAVRIPELYR